MRSLSQYVKELFVSLKAQASSYKCDVSGFEPLNRLYGYILFFMSPTKVLLFDFRCVALFKVLLTVQQSSERTSE